MTYSPLLIIHIVGGMIGTLFGFAALLVRKGSLLHRRAGDVFVLSMMVMGASGGYIALVKSQPSNVLAGSLTFYLVSTAWLTMRRRANETGLAEVILLCIALGVAAGGWLLVTQATVRAHAVGYAVFATLASLFAIGDIRMLIRRGVSGAQRLARHLWRMGLALFVAAGSFFLGTASDPVMKKFGLRATLFTKEIRATHLPEVPVIIIVVLTLFWLFRVKFSNAYKTQRPV
jgi:hypothetical protein